MNEHEAQHQHEARTATDREIPDFRRLEVATRRFTQYIVDGIAAAQTEGREISQETARCIAHVLGRAYGRESALADFGRTGEGQYLTLRDEYLDLYGDPDTPAEVKEWIDWLGTYLVQRENTGSGRRFMNEHLQPKLEQLLVRTSVRVGSEHFTVNVPADWDSGDEDGLIELLTDLHLPEDEALQAFLMLPDVSVGADDVMESFHESYVNAYPFLEDAVRDLAEVDSLELAIYEATESRSLPDNAVLIDYSLIEDHVREGYDLIEWKGRTFVFNK
ncbi:hypothetical protein PYV02_06680 [Leifsonia sp. H3M29-4]|uniref:hypothetical protein n=1 Tax=Salinibacterium metalliresistens TaxID=3031321 RepID=UPI0023DA97E1|nr:hypothetical protein [Salinibacterium metalliresistens]MDF1478768.1 hypothetical protein [Salinibacterium metalliresistens]